MYGACSVACASQDIDCGDMFRHLPAAVAANLTTEGTVDVATSRSLEHLFRLGYFDPIETVGWAHIGPEVIGSAEHEQMSFEAALQSVALLRSDPGVLPLTPGRRVAVVGPVGHPLCHPLCCPLCHPYVAMVSKC